MPYRFEDLNPWKWGERQGKDRRIRGGACERKRGWEGEREAGERETEDTETETQTIWQVKNDSLLPYFSLLSAGIMGMCVPPYPVKLVFIFRAVGQH